MLKEISVQAQAISTSKHFWEQMVGNTCSEFEAEHFKHLEPFGVQNILHTPTQESFHALLPINGLPL